MYSPARSPTRAARDVYSPGLGGVGTDDYTTRGREPLGTTGATRPLSPARRGLGTMASPTRPLGTTPDITAPDTDVLGAGMPPTARSPITRARSPLRSPLRSPFRGGVGDVGTAAGTVGTVRAHEHAHAHTHPSGIGAGLSNPMTSPITSTANPITSPTNPITSPSTGVGGVAAGTSPTGVGGVGDITRRRSRSRVRI